MSTVQDHLWCEKYRPKKIADCILPPRMKDYFQGMVDRGAIENMTLSGGPGTGKTTVARALCIELGLDYILINASEKGNIDTIRNDVRRFASTRSMMSDKPRVIILDEADFLNPSSAQPALRGAIEEFSKNCRFIFTANFDNRIIEPLKSRCPVVDFTFTKAEKRDLVLDFDKRIKDILEAESVEYDKKDVAHVLVHNFPDFRRTINLLQRFCVSGRLEVTSDTGLDEGKIQELVNALRSKKFNDVRKWVAENTDNDGPMIRRALYDRLHNFMTPDSVPVIILHMAEFDYKESFVVDKEINMVAFLINVMADCTFK